MKKFIAIVMALITTIMITGCVKIPETTYTVETGIMYHDSGDVVRDADTEALIYKYEHEDRKDL